MTNAPYGFGTIFYGKEHANSNASFIATKWLVFAYIPVCPLGSFCVYPARSIISNAGRSSLPASTRRVAWQKRHILNMYALVGAITLALFLVTKCANSSPSAAEATSIPSSSVLPPSHSQSSYTRPSRAENGSPFPEISDYIKGYDPLLNSGHSAIVINNMSNTTDLYGKLYSLNTETTTPVRVFFVQAWGKFTIENLDAGSYELRFKDLDTGGLAKTEPIVLDIVSEYGQTYFSRKELRLNRVVNGNLKTEPISEDEF